MKQKYKDYLDEILTGEDIKILQLIKRKGSNTCSDLCEEYSKAENTYENIYGNFPKKLNKYANYGLLRKMGIAYDGESGAYYCISCDGLEYLEHLKTL